MRRGRVGKPTDGGRLGRYAGRVRFRTVGVALRGLLSVVTCVLVLASAGLAMAGDPFDDARYAIGIRDNAGALRLIDSGQVDVNMQNGEGYTLLHFAAGAGNLPMVEALLERGADPTIRNSLGMTARESAIGTMVVARIQKAQSGWGKPSPDRPAAGVGGSGDFDKIRWFTGARRNADAIAELDKGIDINMQTSEGYTLLHYAAGDGNLEMVRELIRRGADVNLRADTGHTPYDMAIGAMVQAEIRKAGGGSGINPASTAPKPTPAKPAPARPAPARPVAAPAAKPAPAPVEDARRKMCNARHYASSALCSDSTCKMREYRKWQTCLKTGSYY